MGWRRKKKLAVAQAFQPADPGDFPVTRNGTGKFLNQQTGMLLYNNRPRRIATYIFL
jgi:hypothetical protein